MLARELAHRRHLSPLFRVLWGWVTNDRNNEWKMIEGILKKYGALGVGPPAGWSPPPAAGGAAPAASNSPAATGFGQVRACFDRDGPQLCGRSLLVHAGSGGFLFVFFYFVSFCRLCWRRCACLAAEPTRTLLCKSGRHACFGRLLCCCCRCLSLPLLLAVIIVVVVVVADDGGGYLWR